MSENMIPTFDEELAESKKITPVPSGVYPQEWRIRDSQKPAVDIDAGVMMVPLGESKGDLSSRLHEMVHIKISPKSREELKVSKRIQEILSPLEDYRVNAVMTTETHGGLASLPCVKYHNCSGELATIAKQMNNIPDSIRIDALMENVKQLESFLMSPMATPEQKFLGILAGGPSVVKLLEEGLRYDAQVEENEEQIARDPNFPRLLPFTDKVHDEAHPLSRLTGVNGHDFYKYVKKLAKQAFPFSGLSDEIIQLVRHIGRDLNYNMSFNNVVKQARRWAKEYKKIEEKRQEAQKIRDQAKQDSGKNPTNEAEKQFNQMVEEGIKDLMGREDFYSQKKGQRKVPDFPEAQDLALKEALDGVVMDIKSCKLEVYKPYLHSRRKAPEFVGAVPKHMERLPFDGQVFERKLRGKGGTVLIDKSGSMGLSVDEIERLVTHAPAVLVGAYSGTPHASRAVTECDNHGILWIVAAHGRMVNREGIQEIELLGYNHNIVDVPALEWLTKQKPPRIWVSDGGVTGKDHNQYPIIPRTCTYLCLRHGIIRVQTVEKALELFEKKLTFTPRGRQMLLERRA